ncbi:MAG: hypothetical protein HUU01_01375 [Saprospiraceae bacterium]|nr:hypothetical protein [Saprospiraceae bacterium]
MKLWYCYFSLFGLVNATTLLPAQSVEIHRMLDSIATASSADQYAIVCKLTRYRVWDFDPAAREKVGSQLRPDRFYLREWVLLAGFLGLEEQLRLLLEEKELSKTLRQTIYFALVRCGDEPQLQQLMRKIRTIPVDDEFVYRLVPLLIYTRRKEVTDYLLELLQKEDRNCTPADAETPGVINCAYRILEYLAPAIRDFPLKLEASGNLATDNYVKALQLVRAWIAERKDHYDLNRTTY